MGTHLACITIESRSKLYPFSHHHARNFNDLCTVCHKIHFSYVYLARKKQIDLHLFIYLFIWREFQLRMWNTKCIRIQSEINSYAVINFYITTILSLRMGSKIVLMNFRDILIELVVQFWVFLIRCFTYDAKTSQLFACSQKIDQRGKTNVYVHVTLLM